MASNLRNSNAITDLVATPRVKGQPIRSGVVHSSFAYVTMVTADSAPSTQTMLRVPAHARIRNLLLSAPDFSTAGAINVGVYSESTPGVAGTVIDADFFAAALDLSTGPFIKSEISNQSTTNTVAKQAQPLWQALGVSTEPVPGTHYLITIEVSTTFNSTGTLDIGLEVEYVL